MDPWRCGHCNKLIYTTEPNSTTPVDMPAPDPATFVAIYGDICTTCRDVYEAVNNTGYFRGLHAEWAKVNEAKSRLRPGQDYFK